MNFSKLSKIIGYLRKLQQLLLISILFNTSFSHAFALHSNNKCIQEMEMGRHTGIYSRDDGTELNIITQSRQAMSQ